MGGFEEENVESSGSVFELVNDPECRANAGPPLGTPEDAAKLVAIIREQASAARRQADSLDQLCVEIEGSYGLAATTPA